jgi:hypothetical protein
MTTRRFGWLLASTLLFTACFSAGSSVRVTHNPRDVLMCRYLGEVLTTKGLGDLKRRTRALDANTVFVVGESVSVRNAEREISGQAYRCPGPGEIG